MNKINNEVVKLIEWIEDFPNDRFYISTKGNVYNKYGKSIVKIIKDGKCYHIFYFNGKNKRFNTDKLVLQAFKPINNENEMIPFVNERIN